MSYRKRSWKVENTWKCTSCGHQNSGHEMVCSSCGNPKDKSEKYILGDTAKAVTDHAKLVEANAGENWPCSFCRFDNRALRPTCQQCGASRERFAETPDDPAKRWPFNLPKEDKAETKLEYDFERMKRLAGIPTTPLNPPAGTRLELNPPLEQVQSQANAPKRKMISPGDYRTPPVFEEIKPTKPGWPYPSYQATPRGPTDEGFRANPKAFLVVVGVMIAIALVGGLVWLFVPHEHDACVSSIHWQYTRELQQRLTLHGTDWGSPPGAFNVSCERRQHGTESCHPHDCNAHQESYNCHSHECSCHTSCSDDGNGYSSCHEDCDTCYDTCYRTVHDTCYDQCPVYDEWCNYDYFQWVHVDTETTSGIGHQTTWGNRLTVDGTPTQRILTTEDYTVNFVQGEDHWTYRAGNLGDFNRFNIGTIWDVKTNYAGMIWPVHVE